MVLIEKTSSEKRKRLECHPSSKKASNEIGFYREL